MPAAGVPIVMEIQSSGEVFGGKRQAERLGHEMNNLGVSGMGGGLVSGAVTLKPLPDLRGFEAAGDSAAPASPTAGSLMQATGYAWPRTQCAY
jgi:hypothetical protein